MSAKNRTLHDLLLRREQLGPIGALEFLISKERATLNGERFLYLDYYDEHKQNRELSNNSHKPGKVINHGKSTEIEDISNKLWGGFSKYAFEDLKACLQRNDFSNKDKSQAALSLARWSAFHGKYSESISFLNNIRKNDIGTYRSWKVKLLLAENQIRLGRFDRANEIISYVLKKRIDGHFICAQSNLLLAIDGKSSSKKRLREFNRIYKSNGLSELKLKNPDKGFVFGNITCANKNKISDANKVSILMPVYNASQFVEVAIESMLNQTWKNIEIIAVDDCSEDDSWEILRRLSASDKRLRVYRNSTNKGAYATRNLALSKATGEFITVHDSDDWSHPQLIETQIREMLSAPNIKITFSSMIRVLPNMQVLLRPQRNNFEFVHRSYPSLLIRRSDMEKLHKWDDVIANADDELVQRARTIWGKDAIRDVMPDVPFSFFLTHENSLTQKKETSLNSLTFGIRHEYAKQAKFWRSRQEVSCANSLHLNRKGMKDPFPIPQGLAPKDWPRDSHYDLVIISDLSLLGGTRRCNEGYIKAAIDQGLRVGLFHWPRYDLVLRKIADEYRFLSYDDNVDILVPEDTVNCSTVLIHHPPILKYEIDAIPKIKSDRVMILVNQLPMQLWNQNSHYYDYDKVNLICEQYFGSAPTWIPISPRVKKILERSSDTVKIHENVWYPPYNGALDSMPELPTDYGTQRNIIVGRHSRDHWTKWPHIKHDLRKSYCVDEANIDVHLLGGARVPRKLLGNKPRNWKVFEYDKISVSDFLLGIDFFVHYVHEEYIEEFGRNVMEAMAHGRVAILPPGFIEIFEDAAIYCEAADVPEKIRYMWDKPHVYRHQTEIAYEFVINNCFRDIERRLNSIV